MTRLLRYYFLVVGPLMMPQHKGVANPTPPPFLFPVGRTTITRHIGTGLHLTVRIGAAALPKKTLEGGVGKGGGRGLLSL